MTAPDGSVRYSQTFDPYGNLYRATDENGATIGFGGGTHDTNGLVYAQGQYYNPSRGHFLRHQLNILGQSLSQSQTGREISQAAYNMRPMAAGSFTLPDLSGLGNHISRTLALMYPPTVFQHAYDAFQAGERRPLAFAANEMGITDAMIVSTHFLNQWNADSRVVWRPGHRWYDRLPSATRIGGTGVAVGDMVAGGWMLIRKPLITRLGGNPQGFFGIRGTADIASFGHGNIYLTNGKAINLKEWWYSLGDQRLYLVPPVFQGPNATGTHLYGRPVIGGISENDMMYSNPRGSFGATVPETQYMRRVSGNPYDDVAIYLRHPDNPRLEIRNAAQTNQAIEFDWYRITPNQGIELLDPKMLGPEVGNSNFLPSKYLTPAWRQVRAAEALARNTGRSVSIRWMVANRRSAAALQLEFWTRGVPIKVSYRP